MAKKANIIELNGKRYDAVSGELLHTKAPIAKAPVSASRRSIDGFQKVASKPLHSKPVPAASHTAAVKPMVKAPVARRVSDITRVPSPHLARRHQEHAKTLMRSAVHKPQPSIKRHHKAVTHTGTLATVPKFAVVPQRSFGAVNDKRLRHAQNVTKSKLISRFGVVEPVAHPSKSPASVASVAVNRQQPPTLPAAKPAAAPRKSLDIFEHALAQANSYQRPTVPKKYTAKHKKAPRARRFANIAAAVVAVVVISGFVAYQNAANIQLRMASSKAGFSASMPEWRPSGFAVSKFTYSPGTVAINFHSNSDERAFNLTQSVSTWNSETLLNDFVATSTKSYDTVQAAGRTIYTYGNNNATWVNGGVWYQLTSNGTLSNSQLVKLATSL